MESIIYFQRHPDQSHSDEEAFRKDLTSFVEIRRVNYSKQERIKPVTNEDHEFRVPFLLKKIPVKVKGKLMK